MKTVNSLCCLKCDKEISRVLANTFGRAVVIKGGISPNIPSCRAFMPGMLY